MTINLRTIVGSLAKLAALCFLLRCFAAAAPWVYLNRMASDDPIIRYSQNTVGISAAVNFLCFVFFLACGPLIGRWIAPEGLHQLQDSPNLVLAGVRLVATVCLVVGLVSAVSSLAGWYLQTTSAYVSEAWYPRAEVSAGLIRGSVATATGIALFGGSRRVADYLTRPRATAA